MFNVRFSNTLPSISLTIQIHIPLRLTKTCKYKLCSRSRVPYHSASWFVRDPVSPEWGTSRPGVTSHSPPDALSTPLLSQSLPPERYRRPGGMKALPWCRWPRWSKEGCEPLKSKQSRTLGTVQPIPIHMQILPPAIYPRPSAHAHSQKQKLKAHRI
jgi:hypothetical protein